MMTLHKNTLYAAIAAVTLAGLGASPAAAQKFELRPHVGIGLNNAVCAESTLPLDKKKSGTTEFGLDFGYNFWQKGRNTLSANIGVGYRTVSMKLTGADLEYNYAAPAAADIDGDTYIRYYDITGLGEKLNVSYFNVPVYLGYACRFNDWLGIYADLGVSLGFRTGAKISCVEGMADVYGVYPQYDGGIKIDEPYINGFGENSLEDACRGKVNAKGFMGSLLVGAGLQMRVYGPLWFDLGVRYDCGFADIFSKASQQSAAYTAETAPVTYTVADGEQVRSFGDYMTKSRLSAVSLNFGFSIKF